MSNSGKEINYIMGQLPFKLNQGAFPVAKTLKRLKKRAAQSIEIEDQPGTPYGVATSAKEKLYHLEENKEDLEETDAWMRFRVIQAPMMLNFHAYPKSVPDTFDFA